MSIVKKILLFSVITALSVLYYAWILSPASKEKSLPAAKMEMVPHLTGSPITDDGQVIEVTGQDQVLDLDSSQNNRRIVCPETTTIRFGMRDLQVRSAKLLNPRTDAFDSIHESHVVSMKLNLQNVPDRQKEGRIPIYVDVELASPTGDVIHMYELVIPKRSDDALRLQAQKELKQ